MVMISPVLLAIVLKKVNLTGVAKYKGIRMLEVLVDFVQGRFAHLAAVTLQIGIMPFLCVMISEACASLPPLSYIAPRLLAASKVLVFVSNYLLMALGCGVLLLFHKKALLVISFCSIMAIIVIVLHIIWYCSCVNGADNAGGTEDAEYHSKLEQSLEFSAGITAMMFLVLECVALEGLLRNSQGQAAGCLPQPPALVPSKATAANKEQEIFVGATLFISFFTSAFGVSLMNVWTTPLVFSNSEVLTTAFMMGLNLTLQALPSTAVVILVTVEVLPLTWKPAVWLPLLPSIVVLLVLLARCSCGDDTTPQTGGASVGGGATTTDSASSHPDEPQLPNDPEEQKPAPLELTKVAFTGMLAVSVLSITNASLGMASKFFVFFTATSVLLGLLWRLLTHEAKPSAAVLKAANHASFFAHAFFFCAVVAFWVMAVNATT